MFVDYEYYQNEFGSSELTEDEFIMLEKKSERYLDSLMNNIIFYDRIDNYPLKIQNFIKDCICENCEYINNTNDFSNSNISSYSVNGVSMSFNSNNTSSSNIKSSIYQELVHLGLISRVVR